MKNCNEIMRGERAELSKKNPYYTIMAAFNESYNDKYAGWNEGEELLMLNDVRCGIR